MLGRLEELVVYPATHYVTDPVTIERATQEILREMEDCARAFEADGKLLWQHAYDCPYTVSYAAGPRTTPLVSGGGVFTLGTMGHLKCLDAATGRVVWERDFQKVWPQWSDAGMSGRPQGVAGVLFFSSWLTISSR